jgi:hypothetical protein
MDIGIRHKGHQFRATLTNIEKAGELANGTTEYTAHVDVYRDGSFVGGCKWDGEAFDGGELGLPDLLDSTDDSEDAYAALSRAVRVELAQPQQKPKRVERGQPWRVDGEDRDLEVASVDGEEVTLQAHSRFNGELQVWGRAPVNSMLTLPSWTFLGGRDVAEEGGLVLVP